MDMWIRRILFLLLIVFTTGAFGEEFLVATEELPPYNYTDQTGKITGFSVELLKEMFVRTGFKLARGMVELYPWSRGMMLLKNSDNVILFTTARTEEREDQFQWVGPIGPREIRFWKLKSRIDVSPEAPQDLSQYRIGTVRTFATTVTLQNKGLKPDLCTTETQNFMKLFSGRVDVITAQELCAAYQTKQLDRSFDDLQPLFVLDNRYEYYYAVSKKADPSAVARLQSALDSIKADGTFQTLKTRYLR